jgi:hypothetical protein
VTCAKCLCGKNGVPVRVGYRGGASVNCPECNRTYTGPIYAYADGRGRMVRAYEGDLPIYEARNRMERW